MIQHAGFVLWLTGLSGAGKTTVAKGVEAELRSRGLRVERLDGDTVRQKLTKDLGFSKQDRDTNIERVAFVAQLLSRNNVIVLGAFISPYQETRDYVRNEVNNFIEVYVDAPLATCIQRDVKGLYEKALAGEIPNFTGVNDPYEVPTRPDVHLHTERETIDESVQKVVVWLEQRGLIPVRVSL